jgi:hypothetical protein
MCQPRHYKHACRIQIIFTSPTRSSVTDENHTQVDITFFAQNDLRNNLLKLWQKVVKHSVYSECIPHTFKAILL